MKVSPASTRRFSGYKPYCKAVARLTSLIGSDTYLGTEILPERDLFGPENRFHSHDSGEGVESSGSGVVEYASVGRVVASRVANGK